MTQNTDMYCQKNGCKFWQSVSISSKRTTEENLGIAMAPLFWQSIVYYHGSNICITSGQKIRTGTRHLGTCTVQSYVIKSAPYACLDGGLLLF